jgi:hypothetical protein
VLRTAMLSTRADRYYGPPDGIQPEFDLLSRLNRPASPDRDRAANCIGQFTPRLQPKYGDALGRRTIHHNSSSRKTCVTPFYELAFKNYPRANRVPMWPPIARSKPRAAMNASREATGVHYSVCFLVCRSCRQIAKMLNVASSSGGHWALQSFQLRFGRLVCASSDYLRFQYSSSSRRSAAESFNARRLQMRFKRSTSHRPNRTGPSRYAIDWSSACRPGLNPKSRSSMRS